jgi:hypothetical protein
MVDIFGADPNTVPFRAVPTFVADKGHWMVLFALGETVFWGVDYVDQTEPELDFDTRWTMKQHATKMLAEEIRRRLSL